MKKEPEISIDDFYKDVIEMAEQAKKEKKDKKIDNSHNTDKD